MRKQLLTVMTALAMGLMFASDSLAMYHPQLGRFMQQDPYGQQLGPSLRTSAGGAASTGGSSGFLTRDRIDHTLQYTDGMSLYAAHFVMMGEVDPYGLYGGAGSHWPNPYDPNNAAYNANRNRKSTSSSPKSTSPSPKRRRKISKNVGQNHRNITNKTGREFCGFICYNKETDTLGYTSTRGAPHSGSCAPGKAPCPKCYKPISIWHTHPLADSNGDGIIDFSPEKFSQADKNFAKSHGLPITVNTPGGKDLEYHPKGKGSGITKL